MLFSVPRQTLFPLLYHNIKGFLRSIPIKSFVWSIATAKIMIKIPQTYNAFYSRIFKAPYAPEPFY